MSLSAAFLVRAVWNCSAQEQMDGGTVPTLQAFTRPASRAFGGNPRMSPFRTGFTKAPGGQTFFPCTKCCDRPLRNGHHRGNRRRNRNICLSWRSTQSASAALLFEDFICSGQDEVLSASCPQQFRQRHRRRWLRRKDQSRSISGARNRLPCVARSRSAVTPVTGLILTYIYAGIRICALKSGDRGR